MVLALVSRRAERVLKIINGGEPLEFEPRLDGDRYEFPCGCKFRVRLDEPLVNGHLPIILDRNMTLDCPLVWKMLGEGVTPGVFQLESRLGKTYAMKLKPTSIDHLAALVAVLRPGALRAKTEEGVTLTDLYCMRKNGLADVNIDIEAIREVLEPTYDCLLYQEQTMFIAKILCDFTSMEIDALRAAIGKKKMDKLVEIGKVFVDRAEAKGLVTRAKSEALFEQIKKSGSYQFNRCISGEEFIRRGSKTHCKISPISEMYRIRNDKEYAKRTGHLSLYAKWRRLKSYGTGLSIDSDGRVRQNIIEDIQEAGVQMLYEVKLVDGKKTQVTANHKFPTQWGDLTVKDLLGIYDTQKTWRGIKLKTCGEYEKNTKKYGYSDVTKEDLRTRDQYGYVNGAIGTENYGYTNGSYTKFKNFKETMPKACMRCNASGCRIETHHIDGDRTNSEPDNLENLCVSCHKKTEYANGRVKRGQKGYPMVLVEIESITPVGEAMTYDVTMQAPNHTFCTGEGIMTCNSHSVTYAYGTYESAFFKAHFPVYFYTSYLDGAKHKIDPVKEVRSLIRDARRFGIGVLTPRFVDLEPIFTSDNVVIRFGLTSIKGVGDKAVAKIKQSIDHSHLLKWSWWQFLRLGASLCGATNVRHMIQAGSMTDWKLPRQRMLAEFEAWNSLSEKEQHGIMNLETDLMKTVPVYESQKIDVEVPEYDKSELRLYKAELKRVRDTGEKPPDHPEPIGVKIKQKTVKVEIDEYEELVDERRHVDNIEDALINILERPGAVMKSRREKVASILSLLQNPPYPLADTDHLIAKNEQELLGVAISTQALAKVDRSILNCTLKEFIAGKSSYELLVIGVEVVEVFERTVKNGDNRGAKMASLTVTDGENTLDDVVAFPDCWDQYGLILMRPGALVALGGRRNNKNPMGFVIDKVWSL